MGAGPPPPGPDGPAPPDPAGGYPPPRPEAGYLPPQPAAYPQPGAYPQQPMPGGGLPASAASWDTHLPSAPPVGDGLLAAVKLLIFLQLPALFAINGLRLRYASQIEDRALSTDLATTEMVLGLVTIGYVVALLIPAAVCWCLWQSRTQQRLHRLRPQAAFRHSSGWAVGAWFVPGANLFVPFRAVADLWRNSAPPEASGPDPTPPAVGQWWVWAAGIPVGLLLVAFLVGFTIAASGGPPDGGFVIRADALIGLLQTASLVVGAWVVVRLIGGIHDRVRALESPVA